MQPCKRFLLLPPALVMLAMAACEQPDSASADGTSRATQTAYRLRSDFDAPLNANEGWAAEANQDATLQTEQPFRLRFEIEHDGDSFAPQRYGLQFRRNGGDWGRVQVAEFPYSEVEELTPRVSIISSAAFTNGDETTDTLEISELAYAGGAGIALAPETPPGPSTSGQTEWEWTLVIRRYADGAVTNDSGDVFEFRMIDAGGNPVEAERYAAVTVDVPARLLGGTFVETPARLGPWQAGNGDLYFIMEPAESFNVLMVVKSTDDGATWREVDGANRPANGDLEGFASVQTGDTIHMLHQYSDVVYHAFRTSDHPTQPDTWAVRDEPVTTLPAEPPVQAASLAARPDGSVVGVYAGPEKIRYRIRTPDGEWQNEIVVDEDVPPALSGPQTVTGSDGRVHLAYTGRDGTAWYRQILQDGTLTPRVEVAAGLGTSEADIGAILPLVHIAATDTVVVIYRIESGELRERRIAADGAMTEPRQVTTRRVVRNAVDSDQAGADAIAHGSNVHVLFIEESSGSIFHTRTTPDGSWTPASVAVDGIRGQWVRGSPVMLETGIRYGFVYDAGSNGGSGANWFADLPLAED